ncbi:MAG: hypothetical protein H8E37_09340 [Planctomycetes bacterium]|nr:hypothetical protein [Planctomycetota bacterium]
MLDHKSFIDFLFGTSGSFVIGVGAFDSTDSGGLITGKAPDFGDVYSLHISLENHALAPAVDINLNVLDNFFDGNNNGTSQEMLIENTGSGFVNLTLDGNSSLNSVPPGRSTSTC